MAVLKCYSGGKIVKKMDIKYGYEAEEGNIVVLDKRGKTVFFWSGTFSVESENV